MVQWQAGSLQHEGAGDPDDARASWDLPEDHTQAPEWSITTGLHFLLYLTLRR